MVVAAGFCAWIYEYHKLATIGLHQNSEWSIYMINLVDNTKLLLLDSESFSLSVRQPVRQSVCHSVSQSIIQSVSQTASESDSQLVRQPVSQSVRQLASQLASQSVSQSIR